MEKIFGVIAVKVAGKNRVEEDCGDPEPLQMGNPLFDLPDPVLPVSRGLQCTAESQR